MMAERTVEAEEKPAAVSVLETIKRKKDSLSAKQKIFAEFVMLNPERIGFLSIMEAAQQGGVSQTTIFRFCKVLGYEGYAQFIRAVQQELQVKMSVAKTFQLSMTQEKRNGAPQSAFESVVDHAVEDISALCKSIRREDYYRTIEMIAGADRVAVAGYMASAPLAEHFGNLLGKIGVRNSVIRTQDIPTGMILEGLTEKSLAVLLAFPRYPRQTVELGESLARRGVPLIAVTNILASPIVPYADITLITPLTFASYADPYASPMTLLTAIATDVGLQAPSKTEDQLRRYDEYVSKFKLFM